MGFIKFEGFRREGIFNCACLIKSDVPFKIGSRILVVPLEFTMANRHMARNFWKLGGAARIYDGNRARKRLKHHMGERAPYDLRC